MRAYLIAPDGGEAAAVSACDALVISLPPPSLRAESEAIQGQRADIAGVALDCFAPFAMTGQGTPRLLLRVEGIDTPDLDAFLAGTTALRPDAIILPAAHGRDIAHLGALLAVHEAEHGLPDGGIGIVALIASAAGVLAAAGFAGASPRLCGLGWDAEALARELGMSPGLTESAEIASNPRPHPEVPQRSEGLEGGLQGSRDGLEASFEARLRLAPQDEGVGRTLGVGFDAGGGWSPPLAHARTIVRLAAAAAGVEAIEAAYSGDDFEKAVAAARRDGFAAMFARDTRQARLIRAVP